MQSLKFMTSRRSSGLFARLKARFFQAPAALDEYGRARQLIEAVDRGGIPLNAARVNQIARDLGLEVSRKAAIEDTLARIRAALARQPGSAA